jgi:uncharacterized protein (TIGR02246 family)
VEDQDAIAAVVRGIIDAWNRHDMDAFANLFAEDADFVNVRGTRWIGRDVIREAHIATHATIFKSSQLSLKETSARFLRPDIAVVRSVTEVSGQINASGETLPARRAMLTLVMMNMQGQWTVVVAQNTGDCQKICVLSRFIND